MESIENFKASKIKVVFSDIDDTLTENGQIHPQTFSAIWKLHAAGIQFIPITGRPAGWCEMIARMWPVAAVIGENGAFYFSLSHGKMHRHFAQSEQERLSYKQKLKTIEDEVLLKYPSARLASDQFCRLYDLAIDFCEDVPALSKSDVAGIVNIFEKYGAQAKVSSIHVNGWFGTHNKLTMALHYLASELQWLETEKIQDQCAFIGDSPNDEPMFEYFKNSVAVSNFRDFEATAQHFPKYITLQSHGLGFEEFVNRLLSL